MGDGSVGNHQTQAKEEYTGVSHTVRIAQRTNGLRKPGTLPIQMTTSSLGIGVRQG